MSTPSLNRYPLDRARICIENYKTKLRAINVPEENIVKAYLISATDIFQALGVAPDLIPPVTYSHARVYIGVEPDSTSTANVYKLFMVPVTDNVDQIPYGPVVAGDLEMAEYVLDFNTPCPKTCDPQSPLNNTTPR